MQTSQSESVEKPASLCLALALLTFSAPLLPKPVTVPHFSFRPTYIPHRHGHKDKAAQSRPRVSKLNEGRPVGLLDKPSTFYKETMWANSRICCRNGSLLEPNQGSHLEEPLPVCSSIDEQDNPVLACRAWGHRTTWTIG